MKALSTSFLVLAALFVFGSVHAEDKVPTKAPAAAAADPAIDAVYKTRCATCHGDTGKGDGVAAGTLKPAPRDFADAAWQAKTDDAKLTKAILEGGPAVGLSPLMPPAPDLKPQIAGLIKKVRSFKGK